MSDDDRQSAQEHAVGIDIYVSPNTHPFKCTVKQRYTDFLVNEILPNGTVLHLIESTTPSQRKRKLQSDDISASEQESQPQKKQRPGVDEGKPDAVPVDDGEAEAKGIPIKDTKENETASMSEADRNELETVFGAQTASAIINLYASVIAHPNRKARDHDSVKSGPIQEKSKRTDAHLCVRRIFQSRLETLTVQDEERPSGPGTLISIKAAPPKSAASTDTGGRNGGNQRNRPNWSELGGEYLHFTLYKENKDTMEVLYFLATQMKLAIKNFSFAGTKDRRGVTVQRVAVFRVTKERLEGLNRAARGWRIGGPWEYKREGLDLGMLKGNEFLITLRNAQFAGEEAGWSIEQRVEYAKNVCAQATQGLNERGYLNYYGLQRFGTHSTGTHVTGMKMLKEDLKGAVDSILVYDPELLKANETNGTIHENGQESSIQQKKIPQDDIARAKAIHSFVKTGSSQEAMKHLPGNRFQAEKGMIIYLAKYDRKTNSKPNKNDYQGALMQIQRNLRLMYVHAYQSFVWNTVAGKRWSLYGDRVVEGDLVVVGEKEQEEGLTTTKPPIDEVDEDGEPIIHPSASADGPNSDGNAANAEDPFVRGRPLSRSEAESGRFTIFDVILPLPGYDVEYPSNEVGKFYEEFMASESGGGLDPHNMRRAWKDISLSGGYRKMMSRPLSKSVEVEVKSYSQEEEQLVETDLEKIKRSQASENPEGPSSAGAELEGKGELESKDESRPEKIAVVLKMQLGSSQYATMALRELTKGGAMAYQPDFSLIRK